MHIIKKKMCGEKQRDERLISAKDRFISEVYNVTFDIAINKIDDRYTNAQNVFNDISFFSPEYLQNQTKVIPDSFNCICNWLSAFKIDKDNLSTEYQLFASNFSDFMKDGPEVVEEKSTVAAIFEDHEDNESDSDSVEESCHKVFQISDILKSLNKMGMSSAFANLYLVYKAICSLPPTSVTAERCFSKMKLTQTNLRSTMSEARLDHLTVITCNPNIEFNMDDAINKYGSKSNLLRSNLMYS